MEKETILVLSYEKDLTAQEIVTQLQQRGAPVVLLDTGDFPTRLQLAACCDGETWQGSLVTNEGSVALEAIKSILYRRPTHYQIDPTLPPQLQDAAEQECSRGFGGILRSLDCFWISDIDQIRRASFKPLQLTLARQLGMHAPRTLITNTPSALRAFAQECGGQLICKPLYGGNISVTAEECDVIYTSVVTSEDLSHAEQVRYQAHQFQPLLDKDYELRVTVVGTQVFAARIDAPPGNTDFRTEYPQLIYSPYQLPNALEAACIRLVQRLGLQYGAIDLLRDKSGTYFFLEINPAGQYHWIESYTGLGITKALVDLLLSGGHA
jgi:glutathione synthase/RimK-type ligase-like ATP-grasp enzyme